MVEKFSDFPLRSTAPDPTNDFIVGYGSGNNARWPSGIVSRARLITDANYYVDTAGSDSNDGLTSSTPFLTIQKAVDTAYSVDLNGFSATINVAAGTYSGRTVISGVMTGASPNPSDNIPLYIIGAGSSTVITHTGDCFLTELSATVFVLSLKVTSSGGSGFNVVGAGGTLFYQDIEFGACAVNGVSVTALGSASCTGNVSISGNMASYATAYQLGQLNHFNPSTVTFIGTPAFSRAFGHTEGGLLDIEGVTFVGSATGRKFDGIFGGILTGSFGTGLSEWPGSLPGILDETSCYSQYNRISSQDLGTISSGTVTPDPGGTTQPAVRRFYYTNNGAHILAVPPVDGDVNIIITNGASAGTVTLSGYTAAAASSAAFTTTNGHKFWVQIMVINSIATLFVRAMQ